MSPNKRPKCPHCGSSAVIPILYGDPAPKAWNAAERDELQLGGCCVENGMPVWHCKKCDFEFGKLTLDENLKGEDIDSIIESINDNS